MESQRELIFKLNQNAFKDPRKVFHSVIRNLKQYDVIQLGQIITSSLYSTSPWYAYECMTQLKLPLEIYKSLRYFAAAFSDDLSDVSRVGKIRRMHLKQMVDDGNSLISQHAFETCISKVPEDSVLQWYAFLCVHENRIDPAVLSPEAIMAYIYGIPLPTFTSVTRAMKPQEVSTFFDSTMRQAYKANITGIFLRHTLPEHLFTAKGIPVERPWWKQIQRMYLKLGLFFGNRPLDLVDMDEVRASMNLKQGQSIQEENFEDFVRDIEHRTISPKASNAGAQAHIKKLESLSLNPPIDPSKFFEVENKVGCTLPEAYKALLLKHNGQRESADTFLMDGEIFLPLEKALEKWEAINKRSDANELWVDEESGYRAWEEWDFPIAGQSLWYYVLNLKTENVHIFSMADGVEEEKSTLAAFLTELYAEIGEGS